MNTFLQHLKTIDLIDMRQKGKIKHVLSDIIALALFATIANANDCVEINAFGQEHKKYLQKIIPLKHGIPSHDTIHRALAMISPESLQSLQTHFNELLKTGEKEKIRKILALDGKTQNGTSNEKQKANHIVSAVYHTGFCIGQERVEDKTNEITAIPELLDSLNIKGHIITIDAMGTQREIAAKIRKKRADYVFVLKANQKSLFLEVSLAFEDLAFLGGCVYFRKVERARGGVETREYWQSDKIRWLSVRKMWVGLKSVVMSRTTVVKDDGKMSVQTRYFICSLPLDVKLVAKAVRGHWMVESMHWCLDVLFCEDVDRTVDRHVAYNLNILRKLALNFLRLLDVGAEYKQISLRKKRFIMNCNPIKRLEQLLAL